jgi:hypothetical protein
MTDLSFIRTLMDAQIQNYQNEINILGDGELKISYDRREVLAEKIATLQEYKMTVINFISEANKLVEATNRLIEEDQNGS